MISIITTFHNSEKFLDANIRSVRLIHHQDKIEHILVDDGSTDTSQKIVKSYSSKNLRLISAGRLGRAKSLNLAIKHSKYKYICILDSDDLINPYWVDYFIENNKSICKINNNASIFFGNADIINGNFSEIPHPRKDSKKVVYYKFPSWKIFFFNPIPHLGVMIEKNLFGAKRLYNDNRGSQLDWDLWFRSIMKKREFVKINITTGSKRIHPNQFFEKKRHTKYTISGILLQVYWSFRLKKILLPLVIIVGSIRLLWSIVPSKYRVKLHEKLS